MKKNSLIEFYFEIAGKFEISGKNIDLDASPEFFPSHCLASEKTMNILI